MSSSKVRIIASVNHQYREIMNELLQSLSGSDVFAEPSRVVRNVEHKRFAQLPGISVKQEDWPGERYFITADKVAAEQIVSDISHAVQMDIPGHGSIVTQNIAAHADDSLISEHSEFAEVICILSLPGAAEQMASISLNSGIGVPVITLGEGTGVRDYMGLLRITIPPGKEIVHLVISRYDVESIIFLLIENGYIDRPGGGFIYALPVTSAHIDTKIIIGKQRRAVTIEQIVAAIDEIKGTTSWRKRSSDSLQKKQYSDLAKGFREITAYCREGSTEKFVKAAMAAGAKGATVEKVQELTSETGKKKTAAWERIVTLIPKGDCHRVFSAMHEWREAHAHQIHSFEISEVLAVYSYSSRTGIG